MLDGAESCNAGVMEAPSWGMDVTWLETPVGHGAVDITESAGTGVLGALAGVDGPASLESDGECDCTESADPGFRDPPSMGGDGAWDGSMEVDREPDIPESAGGGVLAASGDISCPVSLELAGARAEFFGSV